eukprot:Rhum_TRINITY_DN14494_c10_g3::Rhum_TRINITY_DN14494_c10_g3_i1::g.92945::m.92945
MPDSSDRPATQWPWGGLGDHPVDIRDSASCLDWMDRKAPYLRTSIVTLLGITSGGKSSALCNLLGCNVRRVGPEEIDRGVTLVRAVPPDEFLAYTRHASAADLSHAVTASARCGAWHRPPAYSPKGDPQRYDALYVHSVHTPKPVREAFRKLVDPALLESADCILVNHAALPAGARSDHLLRTVFVDTKGFSTQTEGTEGTVKDLEKVVSRSSKTVFFFPCFGENKPLLDTLCHITLGAQGVSTDALQAKADEGEGLFGKLARHVVSPPVCAAYDAVSDLSSTVAAKERTVGAHDVWKRTLFVTTGLDRFVRSGGRGGGLDGCLNAHYAAGQFMGRVPAPLLPTPKPYVVSVPSEEELQGVGPEDRAYHNRVNQWGELESALFDRLPDEVCDVAARFFDHAVNNRSIAQHVPSFIANTDAWYASKIEEIHNCPYWREHRAQARARSS